MGREEPREIRIIEDRWATFRHVIEAVAIVAAGAWAFYTFVYTEKIKPSGEPAALGPSISLSRLGRDAHRDILSINVSFHNAGHTELDIAADAYNVWGVRYAASEAAKTVESGDYRITSRLLPITRKTIVKAFAELRDASVGGRKGAHFVLEPGDTQTFGDVIAVRRGEYDALHAQIVAVPVKTSESQKRRVTIVKHRDGSFWLEPSDSDTVEDDTESDFALVP